MTKRTVSARRSPLVRTIVPLLAVLVTTIGCGGSAPNAGSAENAAGPVGPRPAPAEVVASSNTVPGDVLDLGAWYLTLPTGTPEDPDTVHQPRLATYSGEHFRLDEERTGVVFSTPAGGATTKGSTYPRSELREMAGTEKAAWSNRTGTHTMTVRGSVRSLPPVKPEVVVAQIHDAEDDVLLVRVERDTLLVEWEDGDRHVVLDPDYRLGAVYDLRIVAAAGRVEIFSDGVRLAEVPKSGSGWYFKAGSYLQSNVDRGDAPDAVGEVVVQALTVEHVT
ncbi:MAG: polysaccharide lyase family 7 protein [Pseudonocardia sp.]